LVRAGLPRDVALRGVTVVPSAVLGIAADTGSLEVGKKANLLLFSGDPLDPSSSLRSVWLAGHLVETGSPKR
jgi:imidazolonepropionase-like amidohydrolase